MRYFKSDDMAADGIDGEVVLDHEAMFRRHKQRHDDQRSLTQQST